MVAQWLFFSKGTEINPARFPGWGIDGWLIDVRTEKNKNSSSQHSITVVFDKRNGIDKFWSEFIFLSDHTPSEKKMFRDGKVEEFYPLLIKTEGAYSKLEVIDPSSGEIEYESKKFYKKNAKTLYNDDEEFRKWFDVAVDYSCKERITKGLLKVDTTRIDGNSRREAIPVFDDEENMENSQEQVITEYEQPAAETEQPKKRGRPGRKKKAVAESSNDEFLENSSIIEE